MSLRNLTVKQFFELDEHVNCSEIVKLIEEEPQTFEKCDEWPFEKFIELETLANTKFNSDKDAVYAYCNLYFSFKELNKDGSIKKIDTMPIFYCYGLTLHLISEIKRLLQKESDTLKNKTIDKDWDFACGNKLDRFARFNIVYSFCEKFHWTPDYILQMPFDMILLFRDYGNTVEPIQRDYYKLKQPKQ